MFKQHPDAIGDGGDDGDRLFLSLFTIEQEKKRRMGASSASPEAERR
jgi:hypothetical protein